MAGQRPWRDIRGDPDRDPERRRRVVESRHEAEEEGAPMSKPWPSRAAHAPTRGTSWRQRSTRPNPGLPHRGAGEQPLAVVAVGRDVTLVSMYSRG